MSLLPLLRSLARGGGPAVVLLLCATTLPVRATSLIVPDQSPTVQSALDAWVDTVLVRPGAYPETLRVERTVTVLGMSEGPDARPSVMGLIIHPYETLGPPFVFRRLRFTGTVALASGGWSEFAFTDCDLEGSLTDNLKNYAITFSRCRVTGSLDLWTDGMVLDSCVVAGSVGCSKDSPVSVRGCTIQGGGVFCPNNNSLVEGNTIRGGGVGVYSRADGATIAGNLIEDCQGDGITIDQGSATISNNLIRRCGVGISVGYAGSVSIVGNTIERSRFSGLSIGGVYEADVIGNTFWMCAGDGMRAGHAYRYRLTARNNTSCFNGLSGFVSDPYDYEAQEWTGNIGAGNGQYGFRWLRPGNGAFDCNDWYGNLLGEVQGRPFGGAEFSVDPQFCDGPDGDLHLDVASALLAWPGCGPIGALGAACGTVVGVGDGSAAPVGFALARVGPVPTTGRIAFELTLPRAAAIEVTVHDVQGRTVARLAGGEWNTGRHAIEWNGEGARGRVPPGLYLIRYRFPGGQDSRRIVISR